MRLIVATQQTDKVANQRVQICLSCTTSLLKGRVLILLLTQSDRKKAKEAKKA